MATRVLLLTQKRTYRLDDIQAAADKLGVRLTVGSDRCHRLSKGWQDEDLTLPLEDEARCFTHVEKAHAAAGFAAIVGTCDQTSALAARLSARLGLRTNPPEAAAIARNKALLRTCLTAGNVATPRARSFALPRDVGVAAEVIADVVARELGWPVVVKPALLSGSRGVMRADDAPSLHACLERLTRILADPDLKRSRDPDRAKIVVEEFIPGVEVAVEGLLHDGELQVLAFFDKPDPLDGPFFEETLYITPSRHPAPVQLETVAAVAQAARAMGLTHGPVHAELRLDARHGGRPVVIEAAARSIGGLCSRMLRFGTGRSLDEVVLEAALGRAYQAPPREVAAVGVMMLPIPRAGIFHGVDGVAEALRVSGVTEVAITVREGEELVPLPEGASYLGFMFARGEAPALVEEALREGHRRLRFNIHGKLPVA
ncbi:MAG: ATP-grasp domain-containing protein [Myxococcota bacterium]